MLGYSDLLIAAAAVAALVFLGRRLARKPPRARRRPPRPGFAPHTIAGKAYVTDADGLRVRGREIRLAGLDSPEYRQLARTPEGRWIDHGSHVKSRLIERVGGRRLRVDVMREDKFGRMVGVAFDDAGNDINEWLVREGLAIAAFGPPDYAEAEAWAAQRGLGMWGMQTAYDPRGWKHGKRVPVGARKA